MSTGTRFSIGGFSELSSDAAFRRVIAEILSAPMAEAVSTGADKVRDSDANESLAYRFVIENPRHRIVSNEVHSLNLSVAAARFVWMISGNNRLADIEFYEPMVKNFSDDGIIVPGSSYGTRIRQAHPGIDQLSGVIATLREDSNSRRAAISIYQPTDSIRHTSNDIPCAFGMFFHAREGSLHTQLVIRSNNAIMLLPFNLFEFSLLAEMVASECGLEMGPFSHYAASMHIYEKNKDLAEKISKGGKNTKSSAMPKMPFDPNPLGQIRKLVNYEADMRHRSKSISDASIETEIDKIRNTFCVYWQQLAFLLVYALTTKPDTNCTRESAKALIAAMNPDMAGLLDLGKTKPELHTSSDLPLLAKLQGDSNLISFSQTTAGKSFMKQAEAYEKAEGNPLPATVILNAFAMAESRMAARGLENEITEEDYFKLIEKASKGI